MGHKGFKAAFSPTNALGARVGFCVHRRGFSVHHRSWSHIRERAVECAALSTAADSIVASEGSGREIWERLVRLTSRLFIGAAVTVLIDETLSRFTFTEPALFNEAAIIAPISCEAVLVIAFLFSSDDPIPAEAL